MDVIATDAARAAEYALKNFSLDMGFGNDENRFDLKLADDGLDLGAGSLVYVDATEYGGVVDWVRVDTRTRTKTYGGRTWHGVLEGKIVKPPAGASHYVARGEANRALGCLIAHLDLEDMFEASPADSGISVECRIDRFARAYTAIRKMLLGSNSKLVIEKMPTKVRLSAAPVTDWSQDDLMSDELDFAMKKEWRPVNHLVCAGSGEGAGRTVADVYADADGDVSDEQTFFGADEIAAYYDYPNADLDELVEKGTDRLREMQNGDELSVSLDPAREYCIDDVVGSVSSEAGIAAANHIVQKTLRIKDGFADVSYEVGNTVGRLDERSETKPVVPGNMTHVGTVPPEAFAAGDTWYNPETRRTYIAKEAASG